MKEGDYIYVSYWHMIDKVLKIDGNEITIQQITPVNPRDDLDNQSIGKIRTHMTCMDKSDRIMTKEEVEEFVIKYCSEKAKERISKIL